MNIRDRIFQKLTEMNMTQKEFANKTGIPETTVSDWKKKKTNPTSEKILIICKMPLKDRSNRKLLRKFININYEVENSQRKK